ncbi:Beta-glucosidase, family GH3 [Zostera marina]|uniref:Beta-glucosidase, family GH3 n=1 Tax=Zostera marina TaxID=29655 RepID=A0A0K9P9Q3_ZOSMR|nr:Beta-glucosidase, family GH3 [Zostera marina]
MMTMDIDSDLRNIAVWHCDRKREMEFRMVFAVVLLSVSCWICVVSDSHYVKYKDSSQHVEARVEDLLARMTVAEKVGQMAQIYRSIASESVIKKYLLGSVLSGGGSVPKSKATPRDWVDMINGLQKGALETRLGIPMIYGIDAVHGQIYAYKATIFPHNIGLGATRDLKLVEKIGAATALEVRATGIPYVFAPTVAVCRNPRWGRCYESYSENPKLVQAMTAMIIPGLQGRIPKGSSKGVPYVAGKNNVAACAKHFVGDGGTENGTNQGNTMIDRKGLLSIHMPPYRNAVLEGVSTVMISYSSWNFVKMHSNQDLITNYLKKKLKFNGFVITDWEGVDQQTNPQGIHYKSSLETSINAGIDMVMLPFNLTMYLKDIKSLIKEKRIPMSRINDAVRRILRVKFTMGLFEYPLADYNLTHELGSKKHQELAREAVRKSLVLLKNKRHDGKPFLPLQKKVNKIFVAGTHANNIGFQCGGWTINWQGFNGNKDTSGASILKAIKNTIGSKRKVVFKENPKPHDISSNKYAYGIVVVGELPYAETFGDSVNLTIPEPGPSVIKNVCSKMKCIVILISGRPLVIKPYIKMIDALVAAWLPGTEGHGVTDVLFGDYGFSGKLSRTWFKSVEQLPMNVGDIHYDPLFPFGFGLTTKPKM